MPTTKHRTKKLECIGKAKASRDQHYKNYAEKPGKYDAQIAGCIGAAMFAKTMVEKQRAKG